MRLSRSGIASGGILPSFLMVCRAKVILLTGFFFSWYLSFSLSSVTAGLLSAISGKPINKWKPGISSDTLKKLRHHLLHLVQVFVVQRLLPFHRFFLHFFSHHFQFVLHHFPPVFLIFSGWRFLSWRICCGWGGSHFSCLTRSSLKWKLLWNCKRKHSKNE